MGKTRKSQDFQRRPLPSVSVFNRQRTLPIDVSSVEQMVEFLLDHFGIQCEEINIHFVGKEKICQIHDEFFNDPTITDCITFPHDDPTLSPCPFLGEIFACPFVARKVAKEHGNTPYEELTLYVIHGFLHLLGYDDQNEEDIEIMRTEEKKLMAALAKNGLGITG